MSVLEPLSINRRALCAGAALAAGLGFTGLAHASKRKFRLMFDFPAGSAPVTRPTNCQHPRRRDELNKLYVSTANQGWRLGITVGGGSSPRYNVWDIDRPDYSHILALRHESDAFEPLGLWPLCYGTVTTGGGRRTGSIYWVQEAKRHHARELVAFDPHGSQGVHPMGGLIKGFDGAMYGTTSGGGAHGVGTVFRVTTAGELSALHHFDPSLQEGARPTQAITAGPDGNYYGVTNDGGALLQGALFRMAPDGSMDTLHSFDAASEGGRPVAALALGADGRLYGVTSEGGKHRGGTLFALGTDGSVEILHHFNAEDGMAPMGTLLALEDGALVGTCSQAGAGGNGTIFKQFPSGKLIVRHAFAADGSEGAHPMAGLDLAINGYLYGTARDGGAHGGGTLYSIAP
ncbi:MAG TPA: choice-of-anchor tandem repeat GloVer-containing protein [Ideonella sp.]|nr:choice-of-anchor tandem repeat GloVer-containing protein [Ideonella sp.]